MTNIPSTGRAYLAPALIYAVQLLADAIATPSELNPKLEKHFDAVWKVLYGHPINYEQRMALIEVVRVTAETGSPDEIGLSFWKEKLWPDIPVRPDLFGAAVTAWRAGEGNVTSPKWQKVFALLKSAGLVRGLAFGTPGEPDPPRHSVWTRKGGLPPWEILMRQFGRWKKERPSRLSSFTVHMLDYVRSHS